MNAPGDTAGTLFVVAAPSGAGKSSLVRALLEREADIRLSVSHTTRAPRPREVPGRDYHFVTRERFQEMIAADQFFEYAEVHGDMKGTSLTAVAPLLEEGSDVLLEIDWQGAQQVRKKVPACRSIFILPPSGAELERRLRRRAADSETTIARRLHDSRADMAHAHEFDFIVVNDVFEDTVAELQAIVRAVHEQAAPNTQPRHQALLAQLLRGSA